MFAVRRLLAQRLFAICLCAAALALKLVVPSGYMIAVGDQGAPTIAPCPGVVAPPTAAEMPHMHGGTSGHGPSHGHAKADMPCAFAGLSAASLGAVDPVQLAALVAFVMAMGLVPAVLPAIVRRGYLRPPLRGPPATL